MRMRENHTMLEWERKVRNAHGTFTIGIPKQVAKKWHIGSGSILTVGLMNDGSLQIKLSDEEVSFQKKMEAME